MTSAARAWAIGRCGYWPNLFVWIGNRRLDMEAHIESDMLAMIVAARHADQRRRPSQTVVLPEWANVGRLFATNHRFLSDPAELPNAISSDRVCQSLVIPSKERWVEVTTINVENEVLRGDNLCDEVRLGRV